MGRLLVIIIILVTTIYLCLKFICVLGLEKGVKTFSFLVTPIALIIGGIVAYLKLITYQELFPRIESTIDIKFVGIQKGYWLIEVIANIENKGLVPFITEKFNFSIRCLNYNENIEYGDERINCQVNIPQEIKKASWIPEDRKGTFVNPGIRQRYSYIAAIPINASFVLLHCRWEYKHGHQLFYSRNYFGTMDKLFRVPTDGVGVGQGNMPLKNRDDDERATPG